MSVISVPLDTITGTDFTTNPDVWIGTTETDPEAKGYIRTKVGLPLPEGLDDRLDRLGVVYGGDGSNELLEDDATLWIPLHAKWVDDDPRWCLTEAGELALSETP
ncbi:hypothetical protein ACFCZ3_14770 [Cellulosimicrobium cellulans]|uniref:hypothetical protein n=1 Tax=Cellulosimicrobium cellulans TaxID=1710 RepID=UPI0035DABB49